MNLSDRALADIGAELGSDVPLFLQGPLSVLRGRGEIVESVPDRLNAWVGLILPEIHCSTPPVYAEYDRGRERPARPALSEALAALSSPRRLSELCFNDLEEPAFAVSPPLCALAKRMRDLGVGTYQLTGSGSALFGLFDTEREASDSTTAIRQSEGVRVALACTTA